MKAKMMLLAMAAAATLASGQEEAKSTTAAEIKAIVSDHQKVVMEFNKKVRAVPREERGDFYKKNYPDSSELVAAMEKLIADHPKDPAIIDGLIWMARTTRLKGFKPNHFAILAEHHLDNEKLGELVAMLGYVNSDESARFIETVQTETKVEFNKGAALYAKLLRLQKDPAKQKESEEVFKTLEANHLDLRIGRREVVKSLIAERRATKDLAIGKVAPEIIGKDVDGKEMKLSDYRGKVVVLDFWGDW